MFGRFLIVSLVSVAENLILWRHFQMIHRACAPRKNPVASCLVWIPNLVFTESKKKKKKKKKNEEKKGKYSTWKLLLPSIVFCRKEPSVVEGDGISYAIRSATTATVQKGKDKVKLYYESSMRGYSDEPFKEKKRITQAIMHRAIVSLSKADDEGSCCKYALNGWYFVVNKKFVTFQAGARLLKTKTLWLKQDFSWFFLEPDRFCPPRLGSDGHYLILLLQEFAS